MANNFHVFSSVAGWKNQFKRYGMALAAAIPPFVILSTYLFYRRGFYDLYIANKIFAETSAILLGVVLLIGPLNRLFSLPSRFIGYRKELGITVFALAIVHIISSYFFLPLRFPLAQFTGILYWPSIFGFAAVFILAAAFLISNKRAAAAVGKLKWRALQCWGARIAFAFIILHVFVMKWASWVSWYKIGGTKDLVHPEWPGGGLLIGWFMAFVIFIRLSEFISPKLGRASVRFSAIALPVVYIVTFLWGRQFIR